MFKHLDDRNDGVNLDIFYYTEWDDPIYDEFKDYEDKSDDKSNVIKSDGEVMALCQLKENLVETPHSSQDSNNMRKDKILLLQRFYPSRPERWGTTTGSYFLPQSHHSQSLFCFRSI